MFLLEALRRTVALSFPATGGHPYALAHGLLLTFKAYPSTSASVFVLFPVATAFLLIRTLRITLGPSPQLTVPYLITPAREVTQPQAGD